MEYFRKFKSNIENDKYFLPLSIGQYDIWMEQQLYPDDISNHSHFVAKINDELNITSLKKALFKLSERHESIRTIFPLEREIPVRKILPASEIQLHIEDCTYLSEYEIKSKINRRFEVPFNLLVDAPYKFFLYERSVNEYYLQIVEHHIAVTMDAYINLPVELAKLYVLECSGNDQCLKNIASTYSNYIQKQYEEFFSDRFKTDENYWMTYLSGSLPEPVFPLQLQAKQNYQDFRGRVIHCDLNCDLVSIIKESCLSQNVSVFSFLTATFQALVHFCTSQDEVIVGIPNDTRRGVHKEVIGYTANSLPLRSRFSAEDEFTVFLKKNSNDTRNMIKHRLYPLRMIMDNLMLKKGNNFSDLFKILIVSQKSDEFNELASFGVGKQGVISSIDGFTYESVGIGLMSTGRFNLALAITDTPQGYVASFHYNAALFEESAVQELANNYLRLLGKIAKNPHQKMKDLFPLSDEAEAMLLNSWNQTGFDYETNGDFIDWFEKQVSLTPNATAIIFEGKEVDYESLNALSNQIARHIQKLGATANTLIGLSVKRSVELVASLLAILKVGSAYLPLDTGLPKERLRFMLEDSKAEILISESSNEGIFDSYQGRTVLLDSDWNEISKEKQFNVSRYADSDQLAYVIYTSGSTGKPKGVEISQKSLNNLLLAMQQQLRLSSQDRWLALTTISFDISNLEILLPLSQGATLVIGNSSVNKDPFLLAQTLADNRISFVQATPATWQMLVNFGWEGNSDLTILCGGEALSQTLAHKLVKRSRSLWNMYGPTETTIWSSMKKIEAIEDKITIGRPISNTTFYVLTEDSRVSPIGVPGELHIGGVGLAKGYRNRPDLTIERFIHSPFTNSLSDRLYRTGDLARFLPNGEIEYLGRLDHQVKIRGYRIELGEIEETLKKCTDIQEAVVMAREEMPGNKQLVAYFIGNADESEMRVFLNSQLPSYMLPSAFVKLSQFPLTPNGKVDRKALPTPKHVVNEVDFTPPKNAVEKEVAKVFEDLLQIEKVSVDSHFFSLGGHSLLAAQAVTRINRMFHINLPLKALFEKPTISLIANEVELALKKGNGSFIIPKVANGTISILSQFQQRFWLLDRQTEGSAAYNVPFAIEFTGDLDVSCLQKALDTIICRHEVLRSIFKDGAEGPEQFVLSEVSTKIRYKDLGEDDRADEKAKLLIEAEAKKPFDLTVGPLFRFLLIRISEKKHALFSNFHHIVFDGYSVGVFVNELKCLYESYKSSQSNCLRELRVQNSDYAHWQRNESTQPLQEKQLCWWLEKLNGAPQILNLPTDKARPNIQNYNGKLLEFSIAENDGLAVLKQLAQRHESTLFMLLLSLFHVLLYRYTGQSDMVIGIPVSARTHSDLEDLIGCYINTLPIRITSTGENSFSELIKLVKNETVEAFEHQDVPFERIIESLKIGRSLSHSTLFQVMFNMLPKIEINQIGDLQICLQDIDRGMAHFDLSLSVQETSGGLLGTFEYKSDLFSRATIERMSRHFQKLVSEILKKSEQCIGRVPMLTDEELEQQVNEWNKQPVVYPKNSSILELFESWANNTPDALAIFCGGRSYSYSEINTQANRVAHSLLQMGLKPEERVLVGIERSSEFISAILGVLKAGGVYVPVDPLQPRERINAIIKDLNPFCLIAHSTFSACFSDCNHLCIDQLHATSLNNPKLSFSHDQLAYIIYTSGSTGRPKGVAIDYKSINDRVLWKNAAYPLCPQDVMLHTYSFIFDGSIINYFWPLCVGASLVIATNEEQIDSLALIQLIKQHSVTTVDLLPSLLQNLLEEENVAECSSLRIVFSGGEALHGSTIQSFYQKFPKIKLHNTYGPTEATVEASDWECSSDYTGSIALIGRPIAGARLFILDQNRNIVPIGVPGELHIGGIGLARGYFNDPSLTAEKFISDPLTVNSNERLYRTGDLCRYRADGNIEFLGRIDNQVKIRGYRIDLGEIEGVLSHMDLVDKCIVRVKGDELHKHLVAYVVLSIPTNEQTFLKLMKHYLGAQLPAYMIPQHVAVLDNFPTLPNGKINYKALPDSYYHETSIAIEARECESELEHQLFSVWKEVLGFESFSVMDNFFEIGGNSLLAMRLVARIKAKMGISIPLIRLFQHPTIKSFSEFLTIRNDEKSWSPIVCMQPKGDKEPFFCVHPVGGGILCYHSLANHWQADRPFYGLQARGLEEGQTPHESIDKMAKEYIEAILKIQPQGPYFIGGWSYGGLIAVEMVRQLYAQGKEVSLLTLIDTTANIEKIKNIDVEDESLLLSELTNHLTTEPIRKNSRLSFKERFVRFIDNGGKRGLKKEQNSAADRLIDLAKANYRALQKFSIPFLNVDVALIKSEASPEKAEDLGWSKYTERLQVFKGPGDHWAVTEREQAPHYAKLLQKAINLASKKNIPRGNLVEQKLK